MMMGPRHSKHRSRGASRAEKPAPKAELEVERAANPANQNKSSHLLEKAVARWENEGGLVQQQTTTQALKHEANGSERENRDSSDSSEFR